MRLTKEPERPPASDTCVIVSANDAALKYLRGELVVERVMRKVEEARLPDGWVKVLGITTTAAVARKRLAARVPDGWEVAEGGLPTGVVYRMTEPEILFHMRKRLIINACTPGLAVSTIERAAAALEKAGENKVVATEFVFQHEYNVDALTKDVCAVAPRPFFGIIGGSTAFLSSLEAERRQWYDGIETIPVRIEEVLNVETVDEYRLLEACA